MNPYPDQTSRSQAHPELWDSEYRSMHEFYKGLMKIRATGGVDAAIDFVFSAMNRWFTHAPGCCSLVLAAAEPELLGVDLTLALLVITLPVKVQFNFSRASCYTQAEQYFVRTLGKDECAELLRGLE